MRVIRDALCPPLPLLPRLAAGPTRPAPRGGHLGFAGSHLHGGAEEMIAHREHELEQRLRRLRPQRTEREGRIFAAEELRQQIDESRSEAPFRAQGCTYGPLSRREVHEGPKERHGERAWQHSLHGKHANYGGKGTKQSKEDACRTSSHETTVEGPRAPIHESIACGLATNALLRHFTAAPAEGE